MLGFIVALGMVLAFVVGIGLGLNVQLKNAFRDVGLNKDTAKLYGRAAKILRRLDAMTDLDGTFSGDVLSDETKRLVTEWLADYRKQIKKV